ncbi:MAG: ABC transporter permease [Coriobacteriales bacterium]|jgi:sodium transport system permease protein|nr:ABC transporter permease [Coriobacteriales bacterium]
MRGGLSAIIKKELARFFTDPRSVITTILLPGLMIFALYSFMGEAMTGLYRVSDDYEAQVYVVNMPESLRPVLEGQGTEIQTAAPGDLAGLRDKITNKEVDLLVVFPEGFDQAVAARLSAKGGAAEDGVGLSVSPTGLAAPPNVEIYYNSTRTESSGAYEAASQLLQGYRDTLFTTYTVNAVPDPAVASPYDLASAQDQAGFIISSLLPMLIIIFLFSGCMAVAPESSAGEKERGTIATLLVTPLKRHELAIGKIISLSLIALLAAVSSFVGILLSLPRLIGGAPEGMADASIYGLNEYALLLAVILTTVLLFVGLISVLSAFARTVKEASTLVMPLMIAVMLVGVLGSFAGAQSNLLYYLIPAYNSAQCMAGIFSFTPNVAAIGITIAANLVLTAACVFALTRMFNSERIVFSR